MSNARFSAQIPQAAFFTIPNVSQIKEYRPGDLLGRRKEAPTYSRVKALQWLSSTKLLEYVYQHKWLAIRIVS